MNNLNSQINIFSIGHSNHSLKNLIDLLIRYKINLLVDVRSQPYSKSEFAMHFNKENLEKEIIKANIEYKYFGKTLGGRPINNEFYNEQNYVLYDKLASSSFYQQSLTEVIELAQPLVNLALMCSEENPRVCHRHLLISKTLFENYKINVIHIRGNSSSEDYNSLLIEEQNNATSNLFADFDSFSWKSLKPVR